MGMERRGGVGNTYEVEVAGHGGWLDVEGARETGWENPTVSGLNDGEDGNNMTVDCYN